MEKKVTNRKVIKQSNQLSTAKYKLSSTEMKFIALAIAQIRMEDEDFNTYTIKVSDIESQLGTEQNETRLKKFAKGLMSKPFEIPMDHGGWRVYNWFSMIEYIPSEAQFKCRIDDTLKPHLLKLVSHFTKYELTSIAKMNSVYDIRFFQMLNTSECKMRGYFKARVVDLQEVLQVPKSLLRYDNFKRKVLEVAVKEINEKGGIKVNMQEIKEGKKVTEIRIEISRQGELF